MLRILIIKTSSMGDVIHNLPIIHDLRTSIPDLIIDWVVEEGFQDIPKLHTGVDRVIPVAIRRWRKSLLSRTTWQEFTAFKQVISQYSYDYIIDTQGLFKSSVLGLFANGTRHGQDRSSAREALASRLYNKTYHIPKWQHAVERNRQLAAKVFDYDLAKIPLDYGLTKQPITDTHLRELLSAHYIVGLHATSRDSKLWPIEHWVELGKHLSTQNIQLALPWGNEKEHHRANTIAALVPNATVLPRLRLQQVAAILSGAIAAVGVDTGLIHLAAALKLPSIAIYTDTDPALTGTYAASGAIAINMGGVGKIPSAAEVITALAPLLVKT